MHRCMIFHITIGEKTPYMCILRHNGEIHAKLIETLIHSICFIEIITQILPEHQIKRHDSYVNFMRKTDLYVRK